MLGIFCSENLCWAIFGPRSGGVRPIVVGSCVGHLLQWEIVLGTFCSTEQWGKTDCGEKLCWEPFAVANCVGHFFILDIQKIYFDYISASYYVYLISILALYNSYFYPIGILALSYLYIRYISVLF